MKLKENNRLLIFFVFLLATLAAFFNYQLPDSFPASNFFNSRPFKLGLDLQGGAHLVYQADVSKLATSDRQSAVEGVRDVIERRVNALGIAEPLVQTNRTNFNDYRVIVELAGVFDVNQAIGQIGETPLLEFRELSQQNNATSTAETSTTTAEVIFINTQLSGQQLERADLVFDPNTNEPQVSLKFDKEGSEMFRQITANNIGQPIAIYLDGFPISAPVVQQEITGGQAVITGQFSIVEAKELAQRLNAGALPVPIELISQQTVGPALGSASVTASLRAGLYGLLAVAVFMLIFYRLPGLMAVLALAVYALVLLAVFKLLAVTLTLAGIAGFILSLGLAVDANVLIFERMKEELKTGQPMVQAVEAGFARAWTSIRDSNISSLLTAVILYWFGSSLIKGFAITLSLGILLSMFSAIIVTRSLLRLFKHPKYIWLFGLKIRQ